MAAPSPRANEAAWYDAHYRTVQKDLAPWYRAMLPDLCRRLQPASRLIELGCGQGPALRYLVNNRLIAQENVFGIDQSQTAIDYVKQFLPRANLSAGDIYRMTFEKETFDFCLLMETIEHLEHPEPALKAIADIMAPGGVLYVSFPNFLHLPWLGVRLLSDLLNKPNWIVRQPIDKIYTVVGVRKRVREAGFRFEKAIGSTYGPPILYRWETEWMTRGLNALGLWWLSFHPVLVFRRNDGGGSVSR
ncbi:MAG TPA: class I SAM-dependent methyltransferase [Verrucomicrobia bacterium]|nr:class I SAM-dependent methyltransferase [Verrucomicrobiota bacterium]HOP95968.1 class I SAM-dependent methyltransferase [Verrucomicrobiota bacterium]HPU56509.1 class I SAM-dependent methyltransferase [Verrucomicrobiota bacterium]